MTKNFKILNWKFNQLGWEVPRSTACGERRDEKPVSREVRCLEDEQIRHIVTHNLRIIFIQNASQIL